VGRFPVTFCKIHTVYVTCLTGKRSLQLPYLVLENGVYYADDGKMIQAGRMLASGGDYNPNVGAAQRLGGGWHDVT
jgi:hypothetical protein